MFLSFLGGLLYRYNQYYLQWIWSNSLTCHNPSFALSPCLNPASRPVCRGVDAKGHLNQLLKKISVSHQKLIGHRLVRQLICLILVELKKWINWSLIGQWVTSGKNCVLLSLLSLFSRIKIIHMTSINIMFLIMSYHVKYGLMVRKENFKTVQNHQPHFRYVASVRCQIPYWNILKPGSQNGKHGHGKSQIHGSCSRIFPFALIFNSTVCWKMTIWKKNTRILNELNGPWIFHMARNYRR